MARRDGSLVSRSAPGRQLRRCNSTPLRPDCGLASCGRCGRLWRSFPTQSGRSTERWSTQREFGRRGRAPAPACAKSRSAGARPRRRLLTTASCDARSKRGRDLRARRLGGHASRGRSARDGRGVRGRSAHAGAAVRSAGGGSLPGAGGPQRLGCASPLSLQAARPAAPRMERRRLGCRFCSRGRRRSVVESAQRSRSSSSGEPMSCSWTRLLWWVAGPSARLPRGSGTVACVQPLGRRVGPAGGCRRTHTRKQTS
jgi:hypothetical protein